MAEGRWTEAARTLTRGEWIAAAGALTVALSLVLPWYGVTVFGGLVKTGAATLGFVGGALLLTAGAALALLLRSAAGKKLPRPLDEGWLLIAAGIWAALLVGYQMLDKPDFQLPGTYRVGLRYGIFIALLGAIAMAVGGVRHRHDTS